MVFRTLVLVATILSALAWAGDATALSFRTFTFTGVISTVFDPFHALDDSVAVGTAFRGAYTFDPDAPNQNLDLSHASRFNSFSSDGYGLRVNVGNLAIEPSPGGVVVIQVFVGPPRDTYRFTGFESGLSVDGVLSGPSVIFPNASLPLDPPPFASFDFNRFLITGPLIPGSPDEGIALFSLEGELTSLNAIPEPTTLLLVGTTMAGLGLARLRRWRQKQP